MILSQLAPDMTKGLAAWLVSAGAVLWIFNEGRKAFKRKSAYPPNEQLEISHNLLTRRVDGLDLHVSALRQELEKDRRDNEIHASQRSRTIFSQIDKTRLEIKGDMQKQGDEIREIAVSCGEMSVANNLQNQRLAQIEAKLDRLIERKSP
ncbi:MAG: hypothetical protein JWR19_2928 [Pedosphaera sp.]|nr:hypothetical protein [Pedosphaera sp.]